MADFIENSEWVSKKEDVQELASCIIHAVKVNLSICRSLVDLVQILSSQKEPLSDLSPFLINYLLNNFISNNNFCAFLYHLSRINLVSVDDVISKIKKINMPSHTYLPEPILLNIYWFLPEIYAQKVLSKDTLIEYLNSIFESHQENFDENLIEENI